jgi:hypothetical protein
MEVQMGSTSWTLAAVRRVWSLSAYMFQINQPFIFFQAQFAPPQTSNPSIKFFISNSITVCDNPQSPITVP